MKSLEELKVTPHLVIGRVGVDGGSGEVHLHKWSGSVIWSYGGGWDHVSVAPYKRHITPSWEDMCMIKNMFFDESEAAVQFHPARSDYVNMVPNCLHIWKPQNEKLPVPNSLMVGLKVGQNIRDAIEYRHALEKEELSKGIACEGSMVSDEILENAILTQEEFIARYRKKYKEEPEFDLVILAAMKELQERRECDYGPERNYEIPQQTFD